ncbi:hypothetical protein Vadar_010299 [Vaccinium darrowii]|uniref:Uncharacterized protein n=1 Tax=Vaccinium darrowii TaxID=229202 RepID=A0ACB7XPL3_9ERIC|nr:hypothetical protein Vadar_010299 [Vaccinium darrowii]
MGRSKRKTSRNAAAAAAAVPFPISELPNHIICDILSRLPLKSIFTCKLVCSSFRNLTLEPHFPQLHLSRSPLTLILYRQSTDYETTFFGFLPFDNSLADLCRRRATIQFKSQIEFPSGPKSAVSCCNGLICLADYSLSDNVCTFNPVTRQHFSFPKRKEIQTVSNRRPHCLGSGYEFAFVSGFGFGYCRSTSLYKVVEFTENYENEPCTLHCSIYTLGVDDKWRTLGSTGQPIPHPLTLVFFNGALHWLCSKDSLLLLCYFDMEKEQCGNLPLPELFAVPSRRLEKTCFHLGVVDNCLYICDERACQLSIHIWVMKDYGKYWVLDFGMDYSTTTSFLV